MTTQLVNNVVSTETERKCIRNLLIITNLDNPVDMVSNVINNIDKVKMDEGKIVEGDLWCADVSDARSNTALVDNNIAIIQKNDSTLKLDIGMHLHDEVQDDQRHAAYMNSAENSPGEKKMPNSPLNKPSILLVTSFGPDEPLQFDLDNRSQTHASITISASQASHHDSQSSNHAPVSPVRIGAHVSVVESQVLPITSSVIILGEKSGGMKETLESHKLCTNTSPQNLSYPFHVNIPQNNEPHSTSPSKQVLQSKTHRTRRQIRPFVYSASGSLECVNQNSLGSFHRKLYLASKSKAKSARRENPKISHASKKTHRGASEGLKRIDTVNFDAVSKTKTQHSSTEVSLINRNQPSNVQKKNHRDICSQIRINAEKEIETKNSQPDKEIIMQSRQLTSKHRDPSKTKSKSDLRGKKRVTIDVETKKIRPVELFRPSCDAYTPRIGRREIKYKPAKERASVEEMSTTMGTIQRPNFKDALRRVAIIIQQHVVKIERRFAVGVPGLDNAGLFTPAMRDAFSEDNFVTPRYKCNMINIPMARPGVVYGMRKIRTKYNIPTASDIYEFAHQIFNHVHLSSECSIICLIYVERLMEVAKVPVMANTWRPIFMCGLLLASKVWQDWSSWNIEFASVYPQFTLNSVNRLEIQFLKMLKWNFYISPSLYAKYYFALRSLLEKQDFRHRYNRMVGADSRAALEAIKVSKRSEILKQEALLHLSMSV